MHRAVGQSETNRAGRLKKSVAWRAGLMLAVGLALAGCGQPAKPFIQESPFPPAVDPAKVTFWIETPTGLPGNTADDLIAALRKYGKNEGVTFAVLRDNPTTYNLRCHLNAVGDTAAVTVISICDIVDGSGRRVHRIVSQEPGGTTQGDPWLSVTTGVTDLIAQRTVVAIRVWLRGGNV